MCKRTKRGSAAIEGVVGLWLVVLGVVLGTLLMVNVAGVTYYKEKIGFIANQAADYAATLPDDPARHGVVLDSVKALLVSMGFQSTRTVVDVQTITVASRPAVKVTITTPFSTFLSKEFSTVIPPQITLSDTAVAVSNGWYPAYGVVQCPTGAQFLGVMINNTGALPPDSMPAYLISIMGQWKTR
jgi:hypothetical protein